MILPIYLYGHPVLRTETKDVSPDMPNLDQLIADMKETMYASDGIGIAAPQVGKSLRLVYIDVDVLGDDMPELRGVNMVLINPTITVLPDGPTVTREEGCLSVPDIHENVQRTEKIRLQYTDEHGQSHDQVVEGYLARVVQHECDHLEKTLFIDHISPIRKQLIKSKLANIAKGNIRCHYRCVSAPQKKKR